MLSVMHISGHFLCVLVCGLFSLCDGARVRMRSAARDMLHTIFIHMTGPCGKEWYCSGGSFAGPFESFPEHSLAGRAGLVLDP